MKKRYVYFMLALGLIAMTGCARQQYRTSADREVYDLLNAVDQRTPLWKVENFSIDQNACSRYSDFHDPDKQPMPQDDVTAQHLMREVEGMKGWRKWWDNGCTDSVENENWRRTLPVNAQGNVVLNQESAFDLALLHSPEIGQRWKTSNLAALTSRPNVCL